MVRVSCERKVLVRFLRLLAGCTSRLHVQPSTLDFSRINSDARYCHSVHHQVIFILPEGARALRLPEHRESTDTHTACGFNPEEIDPFFEGATDE